MRTTRARDQLSTRELDVLRLAAPGLSNAAIGRELWLTEQTIKFHISNAIRKLEVDNRQSAAWRALELGLIEPPRNVTAVIRCPICRARYDAVVA